MTRILSTLAVLVLTAVVSARQEQPLTEVKTLGGAVHKGELLDISDKEIKVRADGKEVVVPVADALAVELQPKGKELPAGPYVEARLTDGTFLKCQAFGLRGKTAEVRLFSGLTLQFPITSLHYVLCEAQDAKNRAEFEQQLAKKMNQDVLRLLSRDGSAGDGRRVAAAGAHDLFSQERRQTRRALRCDCAIRGTV